MNKYVEPNLHKAAIITIDTQNDFSLPGAIAEIKGTYEVIPKMSELLDMARNKHIPIVHVIRVYKEDASNVDICRKEFIESGVRVVSPNSVGAQLVNAIQPLNAEALNYTGLLEGEIQSIVNNEWVMYKPRWGAFYQTQLEEFLRKMGVDTLIFIGCNFPNCPRTSIYEASERDFRVVMVKDAVSGVYAKGLEEITNIGVQVISTSHLIEKIVTSHSE